MIGGKARDGSDRAAWGNDPLWYQDAIIYELPVRAFFDGNHDGIDDFRGLKQKLDYIHDLGVSTIWLLPFYPSPRPLAAKLFVKGYRRLHVGINAELEMGRFLTEVSPVPFAPRPGRLPASSLSRHADSQPGMSCVIGRSAMPSVEMLFAGARIVYECHAHGSGPRAHFGH